MQDNWQIFISQGEVGGPIPRDLLRYIQETRLSLTQLKELFIAALGDDFLVGEGGHHIWVKRKDRTDESYVFYAEESNELTPAILNVARWIWSDLEELQKQLDPGHYVLCIDKIGMPNLKRTAENITSREVNIEVNVEGVVSSPEDLINKASASYIFATRRLLSNWIKGNIRIF